VGYEVVLEQNEWVGGNFDTHLKSESDYKDGKLTLFSGFVVRDITISDDSKKIYYAGKEFLKQDC
jgi:hypothetical protein